MAQAKGKGCGSAIGCVVVLGVLGFLGWKFYPQIHGFLRGQSAPVDWGMAHDGDALRLRVLSASMELTEIEDVLGSREANEDLHVTLEITNLGDAPVVYKTPRLLRASEPKLADDKGRTVLQVEYGDDARIQGQLAHAQEIAPHDKETHDLVFKRPASDVTSFLLDVDLGMFGRRGVVQFRIPASEIKGLR
jgi:hypothetical protein